MSTRTGKVTPEVALLVKKAEISEGWSVQERQRRFDIFAPGEQVPVQIGKDADATDLRRAQSALSRLGLDKAVTAAPPKPPKVSESVTTQPATDPYPTWTIYEKAKKVWKAAKDYAVSNGKPLLEQGGAEYFLIDDKPLAFFIGKILPKIKHYDGPGGQREVYDYLRSTGHCVREKQEDETSLWIVRTEWTDDGVEVVVRHPRKAVSDYEKERARKERKVTPHEAGEDREPAPVETWTPLPVVIGSIVQEKRSQGALFKVHSLLCNKDASVVLYPVEGNAGSLASREVTAKILAQNYVLVSQESFTGEEPGEVAPEPGPTPEDARLLAEARARQEALTCPECKVQKKKFVADNPQGLAAHRRSKHGVHGTTVKPDAVGRIDPQGPLGEVGMAMEMLRESVLLTVQRAIDPAPYEERINDLEREVQYQQADAQVQRERAERAEQTLACIRLAFDTLPVNKAVAETLDLIPPVTE